MPITEQQKSWGRWYVSIAYEKALEKWMDGKTIAEMLAMDDAQRDQIAAWCYRLAERMVLKDTEY